MEPTAAGRIGTTCENGCPKSFIESGFPQISGLLQFTSRPEVICAFFFPAFINALET
jgi:hypothetical protein